MSNHLSNAKIVPDDSVQKALDFLFESAKDIGEARRQQIFSEKRRAHVEALEMKKHNHLPVSAQSREARASQAYLDCIEEEARAAGEFEVMKARREAASATLEIYRTESANYRGNKL